VPATHVKTSRFEDVDLAPFSVDRQKLPASVQQLQASLCAGPAWEGDPVIVADRDWGEPIPHCFTDDPGPYYRVKFATLIADVATTGNSGSGVSDPAHDCSLGIMSRKFFTAGVDLAKYFVPANEIHEFTPDELRAEVLMK
jgi:hypothetical protein